MLADLKEKLEQTQSSGKTYEKLVEVANEASGLVQAACDKYVMQFAFLISLINFLTPQCISPPDYMSAQDAKTSTLHFSAKRSFLRQALKP